MGEKGPGQPDGFDVPLWRAVAVFRMAALAYASVLVAGNFRSYEHPVVGWLVVGVMAAWTAFSIAGYARPEWRRWPLLIADLAVAGGTLLISLYVIGRESLERGTPALPVAWVAAPVIACAIAGGRRWGAVAAVLMGAIDLSLRGRVNQNTISGAVLMLLAAVAVGHVARLGGEAEERLQRAVELEAATRERERLARSIHDSVLQVLALVQRRGAELGGEAAELGRLAGEQEAALRVLVGSGAGSSSSGRLADGLADLRELLGRYAGPRVSLAAPAGPVPMPGPTAREVTAAVGAALDNVRRHGGPDARAWLLIDDEDHAVTVTVRDDGPGIPDGRLAEAAAVGRLGVTQSICGRVRDLGGEVTITSVPGQGTEVEMHIPKQDDRR